jgi:hypothetical protein
MAGTKHRGMDSNGTNSVGAATDSSGTAATPSRRAILLGAAGLTGVAVGGGAVWSPAAAGPAAVGDAAVDMAGGPAAAAPRSYVTGYFALKLDDINCGLIQKFEGGEIEGEVVEEERGADGLVKKHLGNVKYNEFSVQMGLTMGEPVRKWIESSLQMNFLRKSGELQAADFKRDIRRVHEFKDALITEIGFPACDAGAKDPAYMTLKFAPEITRNKKGSGKVENPVDVKQKQWLPANFRFSIDGLEKACAKVSKVDALTIKQTVVKDDIGQERDYPREPGKIDFPNLKITLAEADADPFYQWHEDFVVKGRNTDGQERGGSLQFLDAGLKKPLLTLTFSHIGIFKGTAGASENNSDKIRRVTFEFYLENMTAKFGG